ncbi:hypothetical protein [Paenibacillus tundrae]|uniref:hypothetical protein n=1 Tax=Paenibacillus tundrae TaxID=528187 RepID=UPI0022A8E559|nr:hypothetical protein [Paenibacillus tundrae]MCZ1268614.1 hypothetical protein [Paenibacillus tundrae]
MKTKAGVILLLLSIILVLSVCPEKGSSSLTVELTVKKEFDEENRLKFTGTTNLPNEMELVLSVTGEDEYSAQANVQVNNGMIESDWISNNGEGLVPGMYSLRITSQAAMIQPDSVQNVIGKKGENLEGEFILSEETLGKMIKYTYAFSVDKSLTATTESETIWDEVNGYLATGQYTLLKEFIDKLQTPSQDLQMMYHLSMYHIYDQAGEEEKALDSLYSIPKGYTGRNEDLINYYKYLNEFYEGESPFSFNDYVVLYRKNRITSDSFAYYKTESVQTSNTHKSDADTVYKYIMQEFDVLTDYGNNYVPEIHDPIVLEKASKHFGMPVSEVDEIFMARAMQLP